MSASSTNNTNGGAFETPKDSGITTGGEHPPGAPHKKEPPPVSPRQRRRSYSKTLAKPGIEELLSELLDDDNLIVMAALKKLHKLVGSNNNKKKQMRKAVCKSDGAKKFTIALKKWTVNRIDVVAAILPVIVAISSELLQRFPLAMQSTGLLSATVAALREHKQPGLQGSGILLLRNAATRADNAKYLVEEFSAHEDIIAAMGAFPDNFAVQCDGCGALRSLLHQGAAFADEDAAFETISRAIPRYNKNSELVTLAVKLQVDFWRSSRSA